MRIDLEGLSRGEVYRLMIQAIVPRPVAWVLSESGDGSFNLAPFSYFTGISSDPPLLGFSVGKKRGGERKDTWRNIAERNDFVVHMASRGQAADVTRSATSLPHGQSELELISAGTAPLEGFRLPRLVGPPVAMACTRHEIIELGNVPQGFVVGRIASIWVDDEVGDRVGDRPVIDPLELDPLARLGGDDYAFLGGTITVPRPR